MTPWLCAYWPVSRVARAGQHRGYDEKARVKVVPCAPILRLTAVSTRMSDMVWSSVRNRITFGFASMLEADGVGLAGLL